MSSLIYRPQSSSYMRVITWRWLARYWWILAMPVIAVCVLGAVSDVRFLYVAVMILFLIVPSVFFFVSFGYATGRRVAPLLGGQRLDIHDDSTLEVIAFKSVSDEDTRVEQVGPVCQIKSRKWRDIDVKGSTIIISVGPRVDDVLIVPDSAFPADSDMKARFIEFVYQTIQRNRLNLQS